VSWFDKLAGTQPELPEDVLGALIECSCQLRRIADSMETQRSAHNALSFRYSEDAVEESHVAYFDREAADKREVERARYKLKTGHELADWEEVPSIWKDPSHGQHDSESSS